MIEKTLSVLVLTACIVLMLRLFVGARRQRAFDAFMRRIAHGLQQAALSLYHWRSRKQAARAAEEAIRRARERGEWEGNVYKPKSFKGPRKLH